MTEHPPFFDPARAGDWSYRPDLTALRITAKAGRPALASIKTWREDPAEVEKTADEIKARYQRMFKV